MINGRTICQILFLASVAAVSPCFADSTALTQGVAAYNKGDLRQALSHFEKAIVEKPYDATAHLYLGFCYQSLKQIGPARQHFQYVASSSKDSSQRTRAKAALNALPVSTVSTPAEKTAASETASAPTSAPKKYGRCKVIMFETDWCVACHAFAPQFDSTASKYRDRMDFERVNAERNKGLADQYGVYRYPTFVYLDDKGKVLYQESNAMFSRRVRELAGD